MMEKQILQESLVWYYGQLRDEKLEKGSLYKLDKNFKLIKVDKNYRITNGPAFIDQNNFYHTDSTKKNYL